MNGTIHVQRPPNHIYGLKEGCILTFSEILTDLLPWCFIAFLVGAIIFGLSLLGYRFLYRKLLHGKVTIPIRQFVLIALLAAYVFIVFGITNFSRSDIYVNLINLNLFSGYRDIWSQWTLRSVQMVAFNILMFVPLGILLPLLSDSLRSFGIVFLMALLFTFTIETVQLANHTGIFELDDLFNNTLGAVIGYFIVMFFLERVDWKRRALLLTRAMLLPVILFAGLLTVSHLKQEQPQSIKTDTSYFIISPVFQQSTPVDHGRYP